MALAIIIALGAATGAAASASSAAKISMPLMATSLVAYIACANGEMASYLAYINTGDIVADEAWR